MHVQAWWDARVVRLRPATQSAYGAALHYLRDRFGRARLADITAGDVARFISARQAGGARGWTIRGDLTALSAIFRHASRHLGYIGPNPVALLDQVERPSIEDAKPPRVLSTDELRRLISCVTERYRVIFELAGETGARLGEVLGLVWGEIDLNAQTVTFTHQLSRDGKRVALKTQRSRRCVEITPGLTAKLREAKLAAEDSGDHAFVFVSREGTPHDHRNIGGRVLARAVKRAGLEAVERDGQVVEPAPTFHSLRHSHGSALIAAGWDIEEVSARLGHSNVATTSRIYVHAYDAARRSEERRNRLESLYGDENTGTDAQIIALTAPTQ